MKIKLFMAVLLAICVNLRAQETPDSTTCNHICSCSEFNVPAGIMIGRAHDAREWMLSYRYMSMSMEGTQSGSTPINASSVFAQNYFMSPVSMRMDMHMLMAMYGLSDRITLMAMGSYNRNTMSMQMYATNHVHGSTGEADSLHHMQSNGIGDLKLYTYYSILKTPGQQLSAILGISLPTGSIKIPGEVSDPYYGHSRLPYAMQLGSGTTELLPALAWFKQGMRFGFAAQSQAVIRLKENVFHYQLGNELLSNIWGSYKLTRFASLSARVQSHVQGSIRGIDSHIYVYNEPAANPVNSGGQRISGFAGLQLNWPGHSLFGLHLEYGLPLYESFTGIQMKSSGTLNAALTASF